MCGLDKQTVRWTEKELNGQAQRVATCGTMSILRPINSSVPQRSVLAPFLIDIFINHLDDGTECTLIKFTDDTKVGVVADKPDDCAASQRHLD